MTNQTPEWNPELRPDWDTYFMTIAETVASRSNCLSTGKGAIIVRDKQIISTGYSGTPRGIANCFEGGCKRCEESKQGLIRSGEKLDLCICSHAEENAIVQAAHHGVSTAGATMYTTFYPCSLCAKMILNAGIKEVVAKHPYPSEISAKLFADSGVTIRFFDNASIASPDR